MNRSLVASLSLALLALSPATGSAQEGDSDEASAAEAEAETLGAEADTDASGEADAEADEAEADEADEGESHNFLHGGVRLVREHALAFGVHHTYLRAQATQQGQPDKVYQFVAPSAAYSFYRGHRFGFLMNLEWFFPIRGWQPEGQYCEGGCSTRKMYDQTLGYDATFMFAFHEDLTEQLSLNAGIGLHANIVELSDAELRDFNNISMGIGSLTTLRYYVNDKFDVGGNFSLSVDWADMIHENGLLRYTINWALSATIGVHL